MGELITCRIFSLLPCLVDVREQEAVCSRSREPGSQKKEPGSQGAREQGSLAARESGIEDQGSQEPQSQGAREPGKLKN